VAGRRAKRFRATQNLAVGVLGGGHRFSGDLIDLSSSGVLIRCPVEIPAGTMVRLGIGVGFQTARIVATARRTVPAVGTAFEFVHMTRADRELVHRLLLRMATELVPAG
jgi:PilZ domain-containing protein